MALKRTFFLVMPITEILLHWLVLLALLLFELLLVLLLLLLLLLLRVAVVVVVVVVLVLVLVLVFAVIGPVEPDASPPDFDVVVSVFVVGAPHSLVF